MLKEDKFESRLLGLHYELKCHLQPTGVWVFRVQWPHPEKKRLTESNEDLEVSRTLVANS